MIHDINLKELEKKAYLSYHDDGLLDILIGLVIVVFGIGMATDLAYLGGLSSALGVPLWAAAKKAITIPRAGIVKFSPERTRRMEKEKYFFRIFFLITMLLGVVVFFSIAGRQNLIVSLMSKFLMVPMGLIGAVTFTCLAWWKQIGRYYIYAAMVLINAFAGPILRISHPVYVIVTGIMIVAPGIIILIGFLLKYSLAEKED